MGFLSIFVVAAMPVLKVLLLGALGGLLATSYLGVLPPDARKHLNKLVYSVFTPAVVFCNLVQAVSLENIVAWWFLPVNVILTFGIGGLLGLLVVKVLKPQPHLVRLTIACCSAGNVGNLPLVLIPAVCTEPKSPFKQAQLCVRDGVAYVSFGLSIATLILWTFIYNLLKPVQSQGSDDLNSTTITTRSNEDSDNNEVNNEELTLMKASTEEEFETLELEKSVPQAGSLVEAVGKTMRDWTKKLSLNLIFNPPNTAVVAAFFIGGIPVLKHALVGSDAPLRLIQDCLSTLGNAMLPSMILLLGGNLSQGSGLTKMKPSVVAGIVVAKLVLVPILGLCVVSGAAHLRLIPLDPLFHLVLLLQYTMPTAMTIGIITQLFGVGEQVSVVLLWSYLSSVVTTTLWTMLYIWLLF